MYTGDGWIDYFIEDDKEAAKLKKRVVVISTFSSMIDIIIVPSVMAILWAGFLTEKQFYTCVALLVAITIVRFAHSYIDFYNHYSTKNKVLKHFLLVYYFLVIGSIFFIMTKTYKWTPLFFEVGNYLGLLYNIGDLVFTKVFIYGFFISFLTPISLQFLFAPDRRKENVKAREQKREAFNEIETYKKETAATFSDEY